MFFKDCKTLEDLKKCYRALVKQYHPDNGGDAEMFKALNNEYRQMFERVKNTHYSTKNQEYYQKATTETADEFIDLINQLIKLGGVHIEIIGSFVWVSGDTKPHKDVLKSLGFKWHTVKKNWYKAPENYVKHSRKTYTMESIRDMYGVRGEYDGANADVLAQGRRMLW